MIHWRNSAIREIRDRLLLGCFSGAVIDSARFHVPKHSHEDITHRHPHRDAQSVAGALPQNLVFCTEYFGSCGAELSVVVTTLRIIQSALSVYSRYDSTGKKCFVIL